MSDRPGTRLMRVLHIQSERGRRFCAVGVGLMTSSTTCIQSFIQIYGDGSKGDAVCSQTEGSESEEATLGSRHPKSNRKWRRSGCGFTL